VRHANPVPAESRFRAGFGVVTVGVLLVLVAPKTAGWVWLVVFGGGVAVAGWVAP
jgi:hypothetical protein